MGIITFGQKEDAVEYIKRSAVYCLIFNDQKDKLAIIRTGDGKYFLPGGGIEKHETHEECMKREALEEMGMEIELGHFLGCAQRYFFSTNQYKYYLSEGYFYLCEMGNLVSEPTEEDNFLIWVEPIQAAEHLFHEHQSWAVNEALKWI